MDCDRFDQNVEVAVPGLVSLAARGGNFNLLSVGTFYIFGAALLQLVVKGVLLCDFDRSELVFQQGVLLG